MKAMILTALKLTLQASTGTNFEEVEIQKVNKK